MPRNRRNNGIFDARGIPKPIIETVQTTARTARTSSAGTRLTLEYEKNSKQQSNQNGHTLTQSTLLPKQAHGLKYVLRQRSDSLEHISAAFKKTCKSMATYFEENSVTSFSRALPINTDEGFFLNLDGRAMFVEPIATYKSRGNGKTYGFIRFVGGRFYSKQKADGDEDKVMMSLCGTMNSYHPLPRHCWDRTETGQYAACHVEKKLIMMLICDAIYDAQTGDVSMFRIEELWERRLEAQIYLDKDPCQGCKNFACELGNATGIQFEMITAKTVVEAEWAKKDGRKHLQPKRTAQTVHSRLSDPSAFNKTRPRKPVEYCIPEVSTSRRSTSGGKRKRVLDDDENDDDGEDEMPVPKDLLKDPFNYTPQTPSPPLQQRNMEANIRPAKLVLPSGLTKHTEVFPSRAVAMDHHSMAIPNGNLPNGHAVPSERSQAIARLQQAKNNSTPTSSRSSRAISPKEYPTTPTSQTANALPTPKTTPLRKVYTESFYSKRFHAEEIMTPSKPTKTPYTQALAKSVKGLCSQNLAPPKPVSPPRSMPKARKRTPTKPAVPRPSERNTPQSIDLTTPEPPPFSKIEQFQYTPPSKSSKRRSAKKVLPVPLQFSHRKN